METVGNNSPLHINANPNQGIPPNVLPVTSAKRDSTNAQGVGQTPPQPLLQMKQQIKQIRNERKGLKKEISKAKSEAFGKGKGLDASQRMDSAQRLMGLERMLHQMDSDREQYHTEGAGKAKKALFGMKQRVSSIKECVMQLKPSSGRVSTKSEKVAFVLDVAGTMLASTEARRSALDFLGCTNLIKAAEAELDSNTTLSDTEKKALEDGIEELKKRRDGSTVVNDAKVTSRAGVIGANAALTGINFTIHLTSVLALGASAGAIAGAVGAVALLPAALAIAADGTVGVLRNLSQVKRDQNKLEDAYQKNTEAAVNHLQHMDDIEVMLQEHSQDYQLNAEISRLNTFVKFAQQEISNCDEALLKGNLTRKDVGAIKERRTTFQNQLSKSMNDAVTLLSTRPELSEVYKVAKGKQILLSSVTSQDQVLGKYFKQRLKAKKMGEYIRGVGIAMTITGTGIAAIGAVAAVPVPALGFPLFIAGVLFSATGMATSLASEALGKKISSLQSGKDHVHTADFTETMIKQLNVEMENWDSIPVEMRGQTTASTMFEMLKDHYPSMPESCKPEDWARALLKDPPRGPEHKDLERALKTMLDHDASKGLLGMLAKPLISYVVSRVTKEKKAA